MKLLTDRTTEKQFDDFSHQFIQQLRANKIKKRVEAQEPLRPNIIAHKKMDGNRKRLVYVAVGSHLHLVTDGNFSEYFRLRRDIPDRVILFSTRKELVEDVESRGFLI